MIDNPDAVQILSDNKQNKVYLHTQIIDELDKLKKEPKLSHIVSQVIANLTENIELFEIVGEISDRYTDDVLLDYIQISSKDNQVLITSDKILTLKARKKGILCEVLKRSFPFSDGTKNGNYSGIIDSTKEELVPNCFFWKEDKLFLNRKAQKKEVDLNREIWGVLPKDFYQSAFIELGLDQAIDIFSVQGPAGTGKTFLSLALAFYYVFERKAYNKIYITKAMIELGKELGFLPGDLTEKLGPYMEYIQSLIHKLTEGRKISKLFLDEEKGIFNSKKFQILPINFVRGMDLEDAFVIVDEAQNLSRDEIRTLLSRMGQNVKCICIGDKSQIDNRYLSRDNNAMAWMLKKFKGEPNYAHLTMDSDYFRGPICELVVKTKL